VGTLPAQGQPIGGEVRYPGWIPRTGKIGWIDFEWSLQDLG
jgi:hypothetical protein